MSKNKFPFKATDSEIDNWVWDSFEPSIYRDSHLDEFEYQMLRILKEMFPDNSFKEAVKFVLHAYFMGRGHDTLSKYYNAFGSVKIWENWYGPGKPMGPDVQRGMKVHPDKGLSNS
jgi:hypothetical protein